MTKADPEAEVWVVKARHRLFTHRRYELFALTARAARSRQSIAQVVRLRRVRGLAYQLSRVRPDGLPLIVCFDEALKGRYRDAAVSLALTLISAGQPVNRRLLGIADQCAAAALPFTHVRSGARVVEAGGAIARARGIEPLTGVKALRAGRVYVGAAVNPLEHLRG